MMNNKTFELSKQEGRENSSMLLGLEILFNLYCFNDIILFHKKIFPTIIEIMIMNVTHK